MQTPKKPVKTGAQLKKEGEAMKLKGKGMKLKGEGLILKAKGEKLKELGTSIKNYPIHSMIDKAVYGKPIIRKNTGLTLIEQKKGGMVKSTAKKMGRKK